MGKPGMPKVLMQVHGDGNSITLRIDQDRLLEGTEGEFPVTDLILFGCADAETSLRWLEGAVDQALDYEIHKEEDEKWVRFYLEADPEGRLVTCAGIIVVGSDYTLADWTQKCRRLISLNQSNEAAANRYKRGYEDLHSRLDEEARQNLERTQRRLLLLDPAAVEKSAALTAQTNVYQRILEILHEIDAGLGK